MIKNEEVISNLEKNILQIQERWKNIRKVYPSKENYTNQCVTDLNNLQAVANILSIALELIELQNQNVRNTKYKELNARIANANNNVLITELIRAKAAIDNQNELNKLKQDYSNCEKKALKHAYALAQLSSSILDTSNLEELDKFTDDLNLIKMQEDNIRSYRIQIIRLEPYVEEEELASKGITFTTVTKIKKVVSEVQDEIQRYLVNKPLSDFNEFITKLERLSNELQGLQRSNPPQVAAQDCSAIAAPSKPANPLVSEINTKPELSAPKKKKRVFSIFSKKTSNMPKSGDENLATSTHDEAIQKPTILSKTPKSENLPASSSKETAQEPAANQFSPDVINELRKKMSLKK